LATLNDGVTSGMSEEKSDMKKAFFTAVCAGSACAFLQGLPNRSDVEAVMDKFGKE